jgi:transposase
LTPSDALVLEATSNAWLLYDQLEPLLASVSVAHPLAVKLIAAARVKTDARDTIKLARLLAANLVPAVWVPPVHVRELRA